MKKFQRRANSALAILLLLLILVYFGSYLALRIGFGESSMVVGLSTTAPAHVSLPATSMRWTSAGSTFGTAKSERAILVQRPFSKSISLFRPCLWIEGKLTGQTIRMYDFGLLAQ